MDELPAHGRVSCTRCYEGCSRVDFDSTKRTEGTWRITANPLSWGAIEPEIIVLGFSKGPTQAGALASSPHNDIPYKGSRKNVGKILAHVGLLPLREGDDPGEAVSRLIADTKGRFHFGSLIRCTVEQYFKDDWRGSGGGMLDKFLAAPFGREVASNCVARFLKNLPARTKLVVLFGMGTKLNYVRASHQLVSAARGGTWRWINDVAYTDGKVTVVHVEHFASQGALIPQWLGEGGHARANYGRLAAAAIASVIAADSNSRPAP